MSKIDGINGRSSKVGASEPVQRQRGVAPDAHGAGATERGGPGVQITSSASQLAALEQALRQLPEVDEARVAQVRLSLEEGRYTVSPERIADRLIGLERQLGRNS